MRRSTRAAFAVVLFTAFALASCSRQSPTSFDDMTGTAAMSSRAQDVVPGRYIVVFNAGVADVPAAANEMARTHGLGVGNVYQTALHGYSAVIPDSRLEAVRSDPRVAWVEPDRYVAVAPPPGKGPGNGGGGGGGGGGGQMVPWGITRVGGSGDGTGHTAFVIDTGVDLDNADLNVDVGRSRNFVTQGKNSPDDGNGHGTHVAGTIAALDNNLDVVGVAAGATVVAVRVLDNRGSGAYSWVIAGVDYVASVGQAGDVANMSLTGPPSAALDTAVLNASATVKFALAAGNDGSDAGGLSPAHVNGGNIYTVSAIDDTDCMPYWSNYGNPPVDFAAPGVGVLSLKRGGGTTTLSGTSMATPHVAGLLILGAIQADGTVACGDPDGNPDAIAHR